MATFRPIASALRTLNQYHTKQLFFQATRKNIFIVKLLQSDKLAPFMAKRSFSSTPALLSGKEGDESDLAGSESDTEEEEVNSEEDFINK